MKHFEEEEDVSIVVYKCNNNVLWGDIVDVLSIP